MYALDLLRLLLHPDPVMRISAEEALRHPYFASCRPLPLPPPLPPAGRHFAVGDDNTARRRVAAGATVGPVEMEMEMERVASVGGRGPLTPLG